MGRKRKKANQTIQAKLNRPWCFYCDRDFDDEKILVHHQRAKHFKCLHCNRRLGSAAGMAAHMLQVHKENLTSIPNAKPERNTFDYEIIGMEGIPEEYIIRRQAEIHLQLNGGTTPKKPRLDDDYETVSVTPPPNSTSPTPVSQPSSSKSKSTFSATPVIYSTMPPVVPDMIVPPYPTQFMHPSPPLLPMTSAVFPPTFIQPPPPPPSDSAPPVPMVQPPPPPNQPPPPPPQDEPVNFIGYATPNLIPTPPPPQHQQQPPIPPQPTQPQEQQVVKQQQQQQQQQKQCLVYENEDMSMEEWRALSPKYRKLKVGTDAE